MKKQTNYSLIILFLIIILIIIIMYGIIPLFPNMYRIETFLDINSGEHRLQTYVFNILVTDEIKATPFSNEIRRLNIPTPKDHLWKQIYTTFPFGGPEIDYRYTFAHDRIRLLISELDMSNISDNERYDILQKALTCLQTDNTGMVQEIENMALTIRK